MPKCTKDHLKQSQIYIFFGRTLKTSAFWGGGPPGRKETVEGRIGEGEREWVGAGKKRGWKWEGREIWKKEALLQRKFITHH